MNLEYYSSLALVASVVVYVVAMFLHAAEWSAARHVAEPATEPALVAVGAKTPPEPVPGPTTELPTRERVNQFGRMGVSLTVLGFLLSLAGVVLRGLAGVGAP